MIVESGNKRLVGTQLSAIDRKPYALGVGIEQGVGDIRQCGIFILTDIYKRVFRQRFISTVVFNIHRNH